jgi:hypothetical protein
MAVFATWISQSAMAFCGLGNPSVDEEFRASRYVFVGSVRSHAVVEGSIDGTNYRVRLVEQFFGEHKAELVLFSEDSSGRFPMKDGERYLFFVHESTVEATPRPVYVVDNCGNSRRVSEAKDTLNRVRNLSRSGVGSNPTFQRTAARPLN